MLIAIYLSDFREFDGAGRELDGAYIWQSAECR